MLQNDTANITEGVDQGPTVGERGVQARRLIQRANLSFLFERVGISLRGLSIDLDTCFQVQEMETCLPPGCRVKFEDPNCLHDFVLVVSPVDQPSLPGGPTTSGASETGPGGCPWVGGKFRFHVVCSEEYNMTPPTVKCLTRIWHPNINEGVN